MSELTYKPGDIRHDGNIELIPDALGRSMFAISGSIVISKRNLFAASRAGWEFVDSDGKDFIIVKRGQYIPPFPYTSETELANAATAALNFLTEPVINMPSGSFTATELGEYQRYIDRQNRAIAMLKNALAGPDELLLTDEVPIVDETEGDMS